MSKKASFLVFKDKLFLPSESFIERAYTGFNTLEPVFTGRVSGDIPINTEVLDLRVAYKSVLTSLQLKQLLNAPRSILDLIAPHKPKLIHAHFGRSGLYALPIAKALSIPLAVTYHGGDATKKKHYTNNPFKAYNRHYKMLLAEADLLLPVSDFIRDRVISLAADPQKVITHYNGVDPEKFTPGEKRKEIIFAGRMVEKKGLDVLAEAFTKYGPLPEGWVLRLFGDGPLRAKAETALKSAGVNARFEGWLPANEMPDVLKHAALVLIPSRTASTGDSEGLPMISMEAMMSGAAIIAAHHAGLPEAIDEGKTGYLFEEGGSAQFADLLEKLFAQDDPLEHCRALGKAGLKKAQKQFNVLTQSKALEEKLVGLL